MGYKHEGLEMHVNSRMTVKRYHDYLVYISPLKLPLWNGWPRGSSKTNLRVHFVGNHFQASSHFLACANLKGFEAHFRAIL